MVGNIGLGHPSWPSIICTVQPQIFFTAYAYKLWNIFSHSTSQSTTLPEHANKKNLIFLGLVLWAISGWPKARIRIWYATGIIYYC